MSLQPVVFLQEERLRGLYQKHQEERGYLAIIAEDLPGGFSKGQIASQLRKLGLKKSKGKKARGMTKVTALSVHNSLTSQKQNVDPFRPLTGFLCRWANIQLLLPMQLH